MRIAHLSRVYVRLPVLSPFAWTRLYPNSGEDRGCRRPRRKRRTFGTDGRANASLFRAQGSLLRLVPPFPTLAGGTTAVPVEPTMGIVAVGLLIAAFLDRHEEDAQDEDG